MGLWLRHTTGMTTTAMRFEELALTTRTNVVRIVGPTLRGNTFDHRTSRNRVWRLVISADETSGKTSTKRDFLEDFWAAGSRELAIDPSLTEPLTGWIAVATDGGESPFEAIDGNDLMPEYSFTLIEKEAS